MALIIPHAFVEGTAPHDCYVIAKVKDLQKSKIVSPQSEAEREAFVEGPAKEAFDASIKRGEPEAYALSHAQQTRLVRQDQLRELILQDRRSTAQLMFFVSKEAAEIPGAKPVHTAPVLFDYDLGGEDNALKQAYDAAKDDPRFAGARDA